MKCAVHAEVDATGFCRNCGKALCPQCTREVKGALYCEECLATMVATPPRQAKGSNPGAAFGLGFVPGLGAVYNGQYLKALVHVLIFGGLIAALSSGGLPEGYEALFGIMLGVFYLYMPFEARRTAKAMQAGVQEPGFFAEGTASVRPVGAIVLIALGLIFLAANFGLFRSEWIHRGWPLILIAIGAYMIWKRMEKQS